MKTSTSILVLLLVAAFTAAIGVPMIVGAIMFWTNLFEILMP